MSPENQNKYSLDELEFIPGDAPFKKEAAWNKLQERIKERSGEKQHIAKYWYLVAASIILVISASVFMLNSKKNNADAVRNGSSNEVIVAQPNPGKGSANISTGGSADMPANNSSDKNSKSQSNSIAKSKTNSTYSDNNNSKIENGIEDGGISKRPVKIKINPEISAGSISNSSALNAIASNPDVINIVPTEVPQNHTASQLQPVRKKLKVFHHNHLEGTLPVSFPALSARSGEVQGTTVFSRNKSDDFIRIKITTPN